MADRWHLFENASAAFLDAVHRAMPRIRAAFGVAAVDLSRLTAAERRQRDGFRRREACNAAIRRLAEAGTPIKQIVRRTGRSRKLVRAIVRGGGTEVFRPRVSSLDAFLLRLEAECATQNRAVFERTYELFRHAIALDPACPSPYAALGMALAQAYYNRWTDDPERALAEAGTPANQAIGRDPADPFAHGVATLVAMYRKDFGRWAAEVEEALSLNPNFAPALSLRATLNIQSGSPRAAIHDLERAMRLDPHFTQGSLHHLGVAHIVAGDYEAAAVVLRERILLVPETDMSRAFLSAALGNLGYLDEARQVWAELLAVNPSYSCADRLAGMPFRNPEDLARIAEGLDRAGLLASP